MILVLLGTQDSPFPRLLQQTEEAIHRLKPQEKVYAQVGTTSYQSNLMKIKDYFLAEEYQRLFQKARIIITHGGAGIIFQALYLHKKVIALPRLAKYGEHNDNHQLELVNKLANLGFILEAKSGITKALIDSKKFEPQKWIPQKTVIAAVTDFIDHSE